MKHSPKPTSKAEWIIAIGLYILMAWGFVKSFLWLKTHGTP